MKKETTTIKFNKNLRTKVEQYIEKDDNKIHYPNPKTFIEIATLEKLQNETKKSAKKV